MCVDTKIIDGKKIIETKALIDCGAQGIFMDEWFTKKHWLLLLRLKKEIPVSNIDKTLNKNGPIKQFTQLPVKISGNIVSSDAATQLCLASAWLRPWAELFLLQLAQGSFSLL